MRPTGVVILQARTNSSRLPGKVLLPINGLPIVVLAGKRAANTGREVIVTTSIDPSDDLLFNVVESSGLKCFRGSLDNVLQRIVSAIEGFDANALIFRLTADNIFPDGNLLDEIEEDFVDRGLDYLCCNGIDSGLPYGMSVELTLAKHLREAAAASLSSFDLEHVTPYIKRRYGEAYFEKYKVLGKGNYRCTIDYLEDYIRMQKVFNGIDNPVSISSFDLINRLNLSVPQTSPQNSLQKLVLGTAQLGVEYGIANLNGKPDQQTAQHLVKTAISNGVQFLDTAHSYGDAERVIGAVIKSAAGDRVKIITKLTPMNECSPDAEDSEINALVDLSIFESCAALNMESLDVVMLHRAKQLFDWGGAVWLRLLRLKKNGLIGDLGVSVQSPEELQYALNTDHVRYIQMPFNVLDTRWDAMIPVIEETKAKKSLVIHVRSALLQGLLVSKNFDHWRRANVKDPQFVINWLIDQRQVTQSNSISDFCLRYVKSFNWIDGVVVGVETIEQLNENINIFKGLNFSREKIEELLSSRPKLSESTLNPVRWIN